MTAEPEFRDIFAKASVLASWRCLYCEASINLRKMLSLSNHHISNKRRNFILFYTV